MAAPPPPPSAAARDPEVAPHYAGQVVGRNGAVVRLPLPLQRLQVVPPHPPEGEAVRRGQPLVQGVVDCPLVLGREQPHPRGGHVPGPGTMVVLRGDELGGVLEQGKEVGSDVGAIEAGPAAEV